MIKQQAVWIFWKGNRLANADYLRDCLDDGWNVSTSDLLHSDDYPEEVVERRSFSGPYGYVEKTTTTWNEKRFLSC